MVHQTQDTITCRLFWHLSLLLFVVMCSCQPQHNMDDMQEYEGPLMEVDSVETLYSDSAILRVRFNAGKQLEYQNGDKEFLKGLKVEFFSEKGTSEAILTARKGYQEKMSSIYRVEDDVVVQNIADKKTLHTEKLFWDSKKKKIYTSEFVKIQTPKEVLTGDGLEAEQDFSKYKILKPKGIFVVE